MAAGTAMPISLEHSIAVECDTKQLIEHYIHPEQISREVVEHFIDYIAVGKRTPGTQEVPIEIHWSF